MKKTPVSLEDLRGVFAVPPLARSHDARRSLDFEQNNLIVRHIANGGITRFIYGAMRSCITSRWPNMSNC